MIIWKGRLTVERIRNLIDLHCDTLYECHKRKLDLNSREFSFSLDKLPEGFCICQCMAVFMPDDLRGNAAVSYFDSVYNVFTEQIKKFDAEISRIFDTTQIGAAFKQKRVAAILTVEGGSVLAGRLENLLRLHSLGVKMMTLTWNAENELCGGCATDLGFTEFGRRAVYEMERLGMAVDVSHLSDRGFWELCDVAIKPFAASHSNSRSVCNHRRNLTDKMFLEIVNRGGIAGINYAKSFIREDGESGTTDDLLRHVHHFLELGGENAVALGSDFDGTDLPEYINSLDKIGFLAESLEKSGIPVRTVNKILFENADNYFKKLAEGAAV